MSIADALKALCPPLAHRAALQPPNAFSTVANAASAAWSELAPSLTVERVASPNCRIRTKRYTARQSHKL
jgi:hypothetical protein